MVAQVLRFVDHCDRGDWHIAWALASLPHDAIVTLECMCGQWAFGTLSTLGLPAFTLAYPHVLICTECMDCYIAHMERD